METSFMVKAISMLIAGAIASILIRFLNRLLAIPLFVRISKIVLFSIMAILIGMFIYILVFEYTTGSF